MSALPRHALYALFALSGACGLIYESVWSHYLRTFLGHAAHAQAVVLVLFVGGLALGAWLAGRFSARLREPLLAYAAAEAVVAAFAFAFHPLFVGVTGWSYATLLPATCDATGVCATAWIVAALLIAVPAIALGATFPWMVAGVLRRWPATPGHEISVLYFTNSLGAVAGVLASAFWLVPAFGLPRTLQVAGALNVLVALAVAAIAWTSRRRAVPVEDAVVAPDPVPAKGKRRKAKADAAGDVAPASPPSVAPVDASVRAFLVVAALTGFASFVYEIVWIRMLSLVLGSATQSFELMLAAFILGLALGSAWIRHRLDRVGDTRSFLGHVQVWMGVAAVLTLPLYGLVFEAYGWLLGALARTPSGYGLYHVATASIALAVMLPATFLAGMTLPLVTHRLLASGAGERAIGDVYAANTLGAIAGVVLTMHVLIPSFGLKGALLAGAAVDVLVGVWLLHRAKGELAFSWPGFATVATGLAALAVIAAAVELDPRRMAAGPYREGVTRLRPDVRLVGHWDGKTATVSVLEAGTVRMIATNGKTDASVAMQGQPTTDEPTQALLGALALGANPHARRAAVIGVGAGITSATLLGSPTIQRVDTIEIERRMLDGAKLFAERNGAIWSDERSHFVLDDAKAFLARSPLPYDVIVSEPSNPWISGVASLFTEETYGHFAQHLAPGGVLVQWLQLYDTDAALVSSVFRALVRHFPHYVAYQSSGGDLVIVASRERTPRIDAAAMFRMPEVARQLRAAGVDGPSAVDERWRGSERPLNALLAAFDAPANSDFAPFLETHAPRARFVRASAHPLFDTQAPVPVFEMLGGGAPAATPALSLALAEALAAPPESNVALAPAFAGFADALRASRELMRTCQPRGPIPLLLEGAVGTAIEINRLPPERASAVWRAVRAGPCYAKLDQDVRAWVDLFAAVGARDAKAMADAGTRAAPTAPSPFAHEFATAAVATGEALHGRPEVAALALDALGTGPGSAWLATLREFVAGRSIAPRPAP